MAVLDLFFSSKSIPGWQSRDRGRKYTEICTLAIDVLVEAIQQARFAILGADPPADAVAHASRDRGITPGIFETARQTAFRFRRWMWSWRAAGVPGIADVRVEVVTETGLPLPVSITGQPNELGNVLLIDIGGVIGTAGIQYSYSEDGGQSYPFTGLLLGTSDTFVIGDVSITFRVGDPLGVGTIYLDHGGRGLVLNDLAGFDRTTEIGAPAGDESILYEIAKVIGDCKIQLVDASGTWWTREVGGYVWRLVNGPWAWQADVDADPTYWSRGVIIITNPPGVAPWEVLGADAHTLGEPHAAYGTTSGIEWWNKYVATVAKTKDANMLILSTILNFDDTKFDPSDASTCMQSNWYQCHELSGTGVIETRPVEYAWFSQEM